VGRPPLPAGRVFGIKADRLGKSNGGKSNGGKTNGAVPEGITPQHCAVVFNSMSHVGTYAQHSSLWISFLRTEILPSIEVQKIKQGLFLETDAFVNHEAVSKSVR
jgi:hypothetical protein